MIEPHAILEKLDRVRAETLKRLDTLTQEQLDWRPPISAERSNGEDEWSLGEIFMHLAIDEHYVREHIARPLLEGVKPPEGVTFLPPPPPYGVPKEVIQFWLNRARTMTYRLIETQLTDANLDLTHSGDLQAMNGAEWLEAYAAHEALHHRQIDVLITQLKEK